MPLTMMLDGEVRTRVSESLAESQLRQSQPVTPEPSFSSYKSHKRLNRSFQLIDIDRSSQVLSINQTNNQPINPSLHKIGCVTTSAKKNNQSPKSRASPRLKIGHVAPILGVFGVPSFTCILTGKQIGEKKNFLFYTSTSSSISRIIHAITFLFLVIAESTVYYA